MRDARSTLEGHSVRQALHDRQLPSTSLSSVEAIHSAPNRPSREARMVLARPRVERASSPVARNVGHMVGVSLRQPPHPLHCSRLATNEWSRSTKPSSPTSWGSRVERVPSRRSPSMVNRPESTIFPGFMSPRGSKISLSCRDASVISGPRCSSRYSVRAIPTPCSAANEPLNSRHSCETSPATSRSFSRSPTSWRSRIGRTEFPIPHSSFIILACAYFTPSLNDPH